MRRFLITLGFMTRIPVPQDLNYEEGDLEKGLVYFPIIGLLLGMGGSVCYLIVNAVLPKMFSAIFAVLSYLFLTGAFHLDGFCDTVDGIYSARTKERMLEIMKDSRIGTNGSAALVINLALKIFGIYYAQKAIWLVLLMPIAGKMIQGVIGYRAIYPRKEGLGLFVGTVTKGRTIACYLIGMILISVGIGNMAVALEGISIWKWILQRIPNLFLAGAVQGILISVCLLGVAVWFRKYIEEKIGGITGDVMGAASEVCEIVFVLLWNL